MGMEAVRWIAGMREAAPSRVSAANLTDEEAMGRVRDGDPQALAVLFDRYKARLFGFLYRMTGERAEAEDLLGDTFLRIYERRSSYRRGCGFAPWAYRIARNLAIRELRHRQVTRRAANRLEAEATQVHAEPLEEGAARAELRAAVVGALRALPEEQRSAAILREYEGLEYREIAAVLGCSEQAARARTYRARLALRAALAGRLADWET
jgi:RNA polymerase sigma-70 factor (ECF subfamily)